MQASLSCRAVVNLQLLFVTNALHAALPCRSMSFIAGALGTSRFYMNFGYAALMGTSVKNIWIVGIMRQGPSTGALPLACAKHTVACFRNVPHLQIGNPLCTVDSELESARMGPAQMFSPRLPLKDTCDE